MIYYESAAKKLFNSRDILLANKLVEWIVQQNEAPTLRQIKSFFANEKVEVTMEELIKKEIIRRENRRYFLSIDRMDESNEEEYQSILNELKKLLKNASKFEFGEAMLSLAALSCYYAKPFFYEKSDSFVVFREFETATIKISECIQGECQLSIQSYFEANRREQKYSKADFRYIGDVDMSYYLDQISVILEKILSGRHRIRPSIFTRSLVDFEFITADTHTFSPNFIYSKTIDSTLNEDFLKTFKKLEKNRTRQLLSEVMTTFNIQAIQKIELPGQNDSFYSFL